jgi:hypothetical protein
MTDTTVNAGSTAPTSPPSAAPAPTIATAIVAQTGIIAEFEADLEAIWADVQTFAKTAEADLAALAQTFIGAVPGILAATAKAAVAAVLASPLTGGVGAIASAAGSAALSVLTSQGQALGQVELLQLQALVNAHTVAAATSAPVAGTGPASA